jgi:DNA-binding GntR family transcriptional regulator
MLDLAGLRSVFEFRLLVEPWSARTAAADRLSNPASALEVELAAFEAVAQGSDVRQELLGHDTRFHNLILAATGNDVVANAYTQSHCHLHVFRLYSVDTDGTITIEEHRRIAAAIRDCRPEDAAEAMAAHIHNSYGRSAQAFERDGVALRLDAGTDARIVAPR